MQQVTLIKLAITVEKAAPVGVVFSLVLFVAM